MATDTPHERHAQKRQVLEKGLESGKTLIHLDARRPGVSVPDMFAGEHALALNLSWRFPHCHMIVNDRGVAATLRFRGTPHRCIIPWSAVWGLLPPDAEGTLVFPDDLPPELGGPPRPDPEPVPEPVEPMRPRLAVIGGEDKLAAVETASSEAPPEKVDVDANTTAPESTPDEPPATPAPKPRPDWLRVVK